MGQARGRRYDAPGWERVAATLVAAGIVALVAFLVIRNEPFADPNLVVATRTLLSLAVAALGATIPGFLHIGWRGTGLAIRAGGALALFVLTFLLTPTVLPILTEDRIPPLRNPRRISTSISRRPSMILPVAAEDLRRPVGTLVLRAAYEGDGERQRKNFDIVLSNTGADQLLLSSFRVRWLYSGGQLPSVDQGVAVTPTARYSITMRIDPDVANRLMEKTVDLYPPIILPPRNQSGPSVVSLRLELLYTFEGARLNYHPAIDWEIFYDIRVRDDSGQETKVLSRAWNQGDASDWLSQFKDSIEKRR